MLLCDCPTCGRRELRGLRSLTLVAGPDDRPVLALPCRTCATLVDAATGAVVAAPAPPTPAARPTPVAA